MGDAASEELGPIDYMVVEFEAGTKQFSQEMARELASLAEADLIRIMDLLVIEKAVDGSVDGLEVEDLGDLGDLRAVGVDWVTLGQYLQPTRKHLPVVHYVTPEAFSRWADIARDMGFSLVSAGPLVRSSYRAAQSGAMELIAQRTQSVGRRSVEN